MTGFRWSVFFEPTTVVGVKAAVKEVLTRKKS